jgi:TolA-binding protein
MKLSSFLSFILVLTVGWMQFYAAVRETYNGMSDLKAELKHVRRASEREKLDFALQREQFIEFRQNVAALMPDVLKENGMGEEGYPYRSLASTIVKSDKDEVRKAIVKTLFESAKENFRKKNYAKSTKLFKQVIDRYSYSSYVTESYFLLAESHFLENELEEATTVIQQMVELFPSHELTGFALIRLGRIYESQNRNEEAVDIYKTVLRSYPQRDVASQAKASLRGLDL